MSGDEAAWLGLLQWPALVVTVIAAWMVSTATHTKRRIGFYIFLVSNVLWIAWGWYAQAYAVILLQLFLSISNIHGVYKNWHSEKAHNQRAGKEPKVSPG